VRATGTFKNENTEERRELERDVLRDASRSLTSPLLFPPSEMQPAIAFHSARTQPTSDSHFFVMSIYTRMKIAPTQNGAQQTVTRHHPKPARGVAPPSAHRNSRLSVWLDSLLARISNPKPSPMAFTCQTMEEGRERRKTISFQIATDLLG
jgi:hypothetical protein